MTRVDQLPPDQRAALSLLLSQRKDYAQVAALLRIDERAVHDRAHAALAVLAPREARALTPQDREQIGDYLLGQRGSIAERLRTRSLLDGSEPGRAWARAIAAELGPLSSSPLPEIPPERADNGAGPAMAAPAASDQARQATAPPGAGGGDGGTSPLGAAGGPLEISRRGGALLLAAIAAIAVAVILIVVLSGGGSRRHAGAAGAGSSTSASSASTSTPKADETNRLTLLPTNPSSKAIGVAAVLAEGSTYAFYLAAEHLPPTSGFYYAVWLYNSPSSYEALSKSPPVRSDGRLQGGSLLPSNAGSYHQMILTRETSERPTRPGPIVLRGSFALH
jgi:hypothetical protein